MPSPSFSADGGYRTGDHGQRVAGADAGDPVTIPIFAIVGLLIVLAGIYGWSFEPPSLEHKE